MGDSLHFEIELARQRGSDLLRDSPRAVESAFVAATGDLRIVLNNGVTLSIPVHLIEGLSNATDAERAGVEISGVGYGLHWPGLDLDLSMPGLVADLTGTRRWLDRHKAAAAGKAASPAKAEAARRNGAKGGRPRKAETDGA